MTEVDSAPGGQRLDIWLYRCRLFKTRTLATRHIKKGKIRLSRFGQIQRINKPGFKVLPSDEISFMRGSALFQLEIIGLPHRRGPASEAREYYSAPDS
ncbi:MAG: RNA-binding S4 domain-containing protein [Hellea sp.]|nr:RNA-binding S4 domain-containing protein [Hellea sp.]